MDKAQNMISLVTQQFCVLRRAAIMLCSLLVLAGCVYELDVQQGNKLEPADVEKITVGMTRSQVRFVLGTPVVGDSLHNDRWDYVYYFKPGRSDNTERRWLIVWFDGDIVREVQRDVTAKPR